MKCYFTDVTIGLYSKQRCNYGFMEVTKRLVLTLKTFFSFSAVAVVYTNATNFSCKSRSIGRWLTINLGRDSCWTSKETSWCETDILNRKWAV